MEIEEKLYKDAVLSRDEKARRRLNVAPSASVNITAKELAEHGVTVEQLDKLDVPYLCYETQLTIHGIFPDDIPYGVGGYKNLVRNQNGSLGVRYSAVDAAKKELLEQVSRTAKSGWRVSINSTSCEVYRIFYNDKPDAKQSAVECYKATPDGLYIGSKWAGTLMWGAGYVVTMEVGAIYQSDFWAFVKAVWGISETEYEDARRKAKEEYARRQAEYEKERLTDEYERSVKLADNEQRLIKAGYKLATKVSPGYYIRAAVDGFRVIKIEIDRFKRTLERTRRYPTLEACEKFAPNPDKKNHICSPDGLIGKVYVFP